MTTASASDLPEIASRSAELEAERAVLGGILVDPTRYEDAAEVLVEGDWFRDAHAIIWRAIKTVLADGGAVDFLTIKAALAPDALERAGGPGYLFSLTDGVPKSSNVGHYARLVHDYAVRRKVELLGRTLVAAAQAGEDSGADLLDRGEAALASLRAAQPGTTLNTPSEGSAEAFRAIEDASEGKRRGVRAGLRELDALTLGWRPGQLIVLGARPSQGKTALALNLALAAGSVGPVLFCSLEMSALQIRLREASLRSGIPHTLLESGKVPAGLHGKLSDALQAIDDGPLYVLDQPGATIAQVRGAIRRVQAVTRQTPALVVVDYLQLMRGDRALRAENRTLEVAQFSAGLKMAAREFGVPVLALSQLSRQSETRQDKRPLLADLRESGALEQDADIVLLLHRPGVYERQPDDRRAEVIVAKQRNGPTGVAHLTFRPDTMQFTEGSGLTASV